MASEIGLRQAYATIKSAYRQKQRNPVTTASDLKLIVPMSTTKTNYSFPVLVGDDPTNNPNAILLNRSDSFTATEMGLFVAAASSTTDTAFDWYSYGNALSGNGMTTTIATQLKTLFNNAVINISINNVQYLQNFSTLRLRKVPIVQTATTLAGNNATATMSGPTLQQTPQDSFNGEVDGFYPLVPTLQLSGTSKLDCQLLLPSALTSNPTAGYIMLGFRGFLSLGASNLNK